MSSILGCNGGYRSLFSFGHASLIYQATVVFCDRNFNFTNDALGKTSSQMIDAARSARQNIIEGSMRSGTGKETELRLYDVARGSLAELGGDYEVFLMSRNRIPWSCCSAEAEQFAALRLEKFTVKNFADIRHEYGTYILRQRALFSAWLEADEPMRAANSILLSIDQAIRLLTAQIQSVADEIRQNGGFYERVASARCEYRNAEQQSSEDSPPCPKCGKPMQKRLAKRGRNAGNPFWSCTDYPTCDGTRSINDNPH